MKTAEFNEAFMTGFGSGNRTPGTSRVHKHKARSARLNETVRKGLSRSAVVVVREDERKSVVLVKGTRELVGIIRIVNGAGGKAYSYQLKNEAKAHKGFASRGAAVERMLEKV